MAIRNANKYMLKTNARTKHLLSQFAGCRFICNKTSALQKKHLDTHEPYLSYHKTILDQGWSEFRSILQYKQAWRSGTVIKVPLQQTSRNYSL